MSPAPIQPSATPRIPTIPEVVARLTAPGAQYEVEQVIVDGRIIKSWKTLPLSMREFWLRSVRNFPDQEYLVYEKQRSTYKQLHERASLLASALREQYGVRKGDRVVIAMRNCTEWVISFWACHLLGAISVCVNGWLPAKGLLHCLTHTTPRVIIVDPERAVRIGPHMAQLTQGGSVVLLAGADGGVPARGAAAPPQGMVLFEDVLRNYRGQADAWRHEQGCVPDDDATILFTSGTTGLPKGVLSTQRAFMSGYYAASFMRDRFRLRHGMPLIPFPTPPELRTNLLLGVPLMHTMGASNMMTATSMGNKIVLIRKWDKEAAADICRRERIHGLSGVPSLVIDLAESSLKGDTNLLSMGFGGAPAMSSLYALSKKAFPNTTLTQGYGLTETNAGVAGIGGMDYQNNPKSTGWPTPVTDFVIVDTTTHKILPTGQVGEIWVRGCNNMRGYWKNDEETNKTMTKDGFLKTGDLAYMDNQGLIYICDRAKDMIIRGGENIHCVNVENAIFSDDRIHDVAVAGIPHRRLGEIVGALVVPKPEFYGKVTEAEVIERCKAQLPYFAVPEIVVFQPQTIERNPTGKILKPLVKKKLEEEYLRRQQAKGQEKAKL